MLKIVCFATLLLSVVSCTRMQYVPVERIRTVTETVHDTVIKIKLEKESIKESIHDTTSTVENRYAKSTATWHGSSGMLEHELETKDSEIPVNVKYIDRLVIDSIPAPYPIYVDRPIEKPIRMPLRWWEQVLHYLGLATLGACVLWIVLRLGLK